MMLKLKTKNESGDFMRIVIAKDMKCGTFGYI
jgi:hypothetical protein